MAERTAEVVDDSGTATGGPRRGTWRGSRRGWRMGVEPVSLHFSSRVGEAAVSVYVLARRWPLPKGKERGKTRDK